MGVFSSISERDLRRVLDVVSPAAVDTDGPEIPEQVLAGLAELVPSACVSFFVMDTQRQQVPAGQQIVLADLPEEDEECDALFWAGYWDCVACCYPERSGDYERVTMWTDFYSEREHAQLVKAEYSRRIGVRYDLQVALPPQGRLERRFAFLRERGDPPYTERDRLLLTLLRPHLVRIRDRVEAQRQTVPVLTPRQLQLLRRVADGHTNRQIARDVGLSEGTVRKHLEHIYTRLEVGSRTEALARMRDILAS